MASAEKFIDCDTSVPASPTKNGKAIIDETKVELDYNEVLTLTLRNNWPHKAKTQINVIKFWNTATANGKTVKGDTLIGSWAAGETYNPPGLTVAANTGGGVTLTDTDTDQRQDYFYEVLIDDMNDPGAGQIVYKADPEIVVKKRLPPPG